MAEHFREPTRCPICLTYFEDPMNLPCGFVCCRRCLPSLPKEPGGDRVVCPNCSGVTPKDEIRPNSQFGRIVSKVKELDPFLDLILQMNPRFRKFQVDMTLDVDTANSYLIISEDLRRVRCACFRQRRRGKRRNHPERFNDSICILGSSRFTSGRHYWEVDLGTSREWDVGVCREYASRQGEILLSSELGFWTVSCRDKDQFGASTWPLTKLKVNPRLHRLAVFLDLEMGVISFYHGGDGSHVFTFPKTSVAEPLRPFFAPEILETVDGSWLSVCP